MPTIKYLTPAGSLLPPGATLFTSSAAGYSSVQGKKLDEYRPEFGAEPGIGDSTAKLTDARKMGERAPARKDKLAQQSSGGKLVWKLLIPVMVAGALIGFYWLRPQAKAVPGTTVMGWRPVASWSGHSNTQTESFSITTGQWRIRWATTAAKKSSSAPTWEGNQLRKPKQQKARVGGKQAPYENDFRLVVHSSVSGRFVKTAAEHHGVGDGMAYMAEEPRQFFLVIESTGLDWMVTVEEGTPGEEETPKKHL